MDIAQALLEEYPDINPQQREIICHDDGPILVIASPGSGKTLSLILRTMNLLLHGYARPEEIVLCTFTEKAAHEMQDRLAALAQKIHYTGDLAYLRIDTIHSICHQLVTEYWHLTSLKGGYRTLEEFPQHFFLFKNLREICKDDEALKFFKAKWGPSWWDVVSRLQKYFDRITEEFVDVKRLCADRRPLQRYLGQAYRAYRDVLIRENCVNFAALQKIACNLLKQPIVANKFIQGIRYVFVDEYQDTNSLQEKIVLELAASCGNVCVVGDEDQALYRFRGATVRNILKFEATAEKRFGCCKRIALTTNYRSHARIIEAYDRWMASADWSGDHEQQFRTDKTIQPNLDREHASYPAVFSIYGKDINEEAEQFADFISFLKEENIISDYNQVALLLHSVKPSYSRAYTDALRKRGINVFCPRARSYFDRLEIRLMMACLAELFDADGQDAGQDFAEYLCDCLKILKNEELYQPLLERIGSFKEEIASLEHDREPDRRLSDYFYQLLSMEPFATYVRENASQMRNLVIFSQGLDTFQTFYPYASFTRQGYKKIKEQLFRRFLYFWQYAGVNEYEDTENLFPEGSVPVMTIHQAKGLEFPVVVVGSLGEGRSGGDEVGRALQEFYPREQFEPENRIPLFDTMRLYYVAFSRAQKLLVLTAHQRRPPNPFFSGIWRDLPQWPFVKDKLSEIAEEKPPDATRPSNEPPLAKRRYSFTGHIKMYETCPRQFQFYREYAFLRSSPGEVLLGLLVHQTIEELHRAAFDGDITSLNEEKIRDKVGKNYALLASTYGQPVDPVLQEEACHQVINYVLQNREEIQHAIGAEVNVAVDRGEYILTGRIDLLIKRENRLEVLDFKTSNRPVLSDDKVLDYKRQLCAYASAVERRYGEKPGKLSIYWTGEELKENALMEFPYSSEAVEKAEASFDAVISSIRKKDFCVIAPPMPAVCCCCDSRHLCISEGIIEPFVDTKMDSRKKTSSGMSFS